MSEHVWCQENLESYAAGGLTAEERGRFERHRAECADCARDLAEWRDVDGKLDDLFAVVRPAAGLEDRMIQTLRTVPMPRHFFRSTIVRFALSAAAVVLLGVLGATLYAVAPLDELAFPGEEMFAARPKSENSLKQLMFGVTDDGMQFEGSRPTSVQDYPPALGLVASRKARGSTAVDGRIVDGTENTVRLSESLGRQQWGRTPEGLELKEKALSHENADTARLGDALKQFSDLKDHFSAGRLLERPASEARDAYAGKRATDKPPARQEPLGEKLLGQRVAQLNEAHSEVKLRSLELERLKDLAQRGAIDGRELTEQAARLDAAKSRESLARANLDVTKAKEVAGKLQEYGYFHPADQPQSRVAQAENAPANQSLRFGGEKQAAGDFGFGAGARRSGMTGRDKAQKTDLQLGAQKPEAAQAGKTTLGRKIIRTGDIEFEVDSFDKAVDRINTLINATKGAFIATTNSDKLPNGKVKGSVVVRMPPESLDKFLLDLRKDLGKIGDLRSQRIGSSDITKQYTDIESRLKAARTMEERLLKIIQSGKGEIKDLVAAERELGNWRTKIEEMEGEIRYYNNQVSLSTLTIALVEKEIRAPSALVVTERVTMRIETEEVEKAQQSAVKAVLDAKGRVTKSELKQHAAGQLEAIVQAEAAPSAAGELRAAFRKLGVVTKLDSDRLQQAVGGSGNLGEIKTRQNDVQFNLTLYNVANIQPRETFNVQVATLDVPGSFRKLQNVVAKAKGQVRNGQLNEQDKLNITANFDFDVPSQDRKAIDKALEETGRILSRSTAQAPPSDAVTDSKVGYRLVLRSVAGIPARERVTLAIEVRNAKDVAAEFKSLVRAQKGTVKVDRVRKESNGTVTALLLFDVPLATKDELVRQFESAGIVRIEQNTENPEVPSNDLATAHVDVTLSSTGPIVPSDEGMWPQIRTSLRYSFKMLALSVMFIILGLAVVVPWALVIWGVWRVVRRMRGKASASP